MRWTPSRFIAASNLALAAALFWVVGQAPAQAQTTDAQQGDAPQANAQQAGAPDASAPPPAAAPVPPPPPPPSAGGGGQTDIFSKNTVSVLLDARLVVADGSTSFVNGGFGKTQFQGNSKGGYQAQLIPAEADLVWEPRFTGALSANVSWAWQRDHQNRFDLIEAFLNYLPKQTGPVGFSARAGLMWPEISLEHSTGGAWSVVNTITPSAINTWVGEEVKVVGFEPTVHLSLGDQTFAFTGGAFGFNDTSGTLLAFRGWALDDLKATATAVFPLPPLNGFIQQVQANETKSTINIDNRPGWYGRAAWSPPWPFGLSVFYYDNRGDPEAFTPSLQWGWRTRFWNVGFNADLTPTTKLLAQAMTGSTIMGFKVDGEPWVHTFFESAYVLLTQQVGPVAITGRAETFSTRERGSEMPPDGGENGWALTVAARMNLTKDLTLLAEAMNVESDRGSRVTLGDLTSSFESQTVFQLSLRYRI